MKSSAFGFLPSSKSVRSFSIFSESTKPPSVKFVRNFAAICFGKFGMALAGKSYTSAM